MNNDEKKIALDYLGVGAKPARLQLHMKEITNKEIT